MNSNLILKLNCKVVDWQGSDQLP